MHTRYFDIRQVADTTTASLAADIARHLQARQHLGKTIIICDKPTILMAVTRKHWLRRARSLQRERSSTINAEKILRLTNTITHMHHMLFAAKPPEQNPGAHVHFVTPSDALMLPLNTYSLYVTTPINDDKLTDLVEQLSADALIIDYTASLLASEHFGLLPKRALEAQVFDRWQEVVTFLQGQHIELTNIINVGTNHIDAIDDALDILLGVSRRFLYVASNFQHMLELAQPLSLADREQQQYDVLILLAHRVQALNPHIGFANRFTYDLTSDETFFLHDAGAEPQGFAQAFAGLIEYHKQAGRLRLARALAFMLLI